MKKHQKIILAISIVISFTVIICLAAFSPDVRAAFNDVVNEKAYEDLKEYALEIAKNSEAEVDESIHANKQIEEDFLIIDVCKEDLYGIEMTIPISNTNWKIEGSTLKCTMDIDSENITYSEYKNINSKAFYVIFSIGMCIILTFVFYHLLFAVYNCSIRLKKEEML